MSSTCPRCLSHNPLGASRCGACQALLGSATPASAAAFPTMHEGADPYASAPPPPTAEAERLARTAPDQSAYPSAAALGALGNGNGNGNGNGSILAWDGRGAAAPAGDARPVQAPPPPMAGWGALAPGEVGAPAASGGVALADAPPDDAPDAEVAPTRGWALRDSPRQTARALAEPGGAAPQRRPAPAPAPKVAAAPWERPPVTSATHLMSTATWLGMRIAVAAVLGIAAYAAGGHSLIGNLLHTKHSIQLPTTVGGMPSLTRTPAVQAQVATLESAMQKVAGVDQVLVDIYGAPASPVTGAGARIDELLLLRGSSSSLSVDAFIRGFTLASGYRVEKAAVVKNTVNDVDFSCFPADPPGPGMPSAVACVWDDYDVVGALTAIGTTDTGSTLTAAIAAQRVAERS